MRAGYRVVADGGNGLTDLAGVDNFSGPRRCSGKGCAGSGTKRARTMRRRMFRTTTRCVTPLRWKQPRRGVAHDAPVRDEKGFGHAIESSESSRRRRRDVRWPRSRPAREHQQHDSSNSISNHSTRNHRFNTVHATAPLMPLAADAVASSSPPPWWPPGVVLRAGRSECRTRRRRSRLSVVS